LWNRFGAALFQHGGHFYNFAGLRAFKAKFDPHWAPRYLAVPSAGTPMVPVADAAMLIAGGSRGVIGR
jgi:phosphatidylglycerol lysyltransferase